MHHKLHKIFPKKKKKKKKKKKLYYYIDLFQTSDPNYSIEISFKIPKI